MAAHRGFDQILTAVSIPKDSRLGRDTLLCLADVDQELNKKQNKLLRVVACTLEEISPDGGLHMVYVVGRWLGGKKEDQTNALEVSRDRAGRFTEYEPADSESCEGVGFATASIWLDKKPRNTRRGHQRTKPRLNEQNFEEHLPTVLSGLTNVYIRKLPNTRNETE